MIDVEKSILLKMMRNCRESLFFYPSSQTSLGEIVYLTKSLDRHPCSQSIEIFRYYKIALLQGVLTLAPWTSRELQHLLFLLLLSEQQFIVIFTKVGRRVQSHPIIDALKQFLEFIKPFFYFFESGLLFLQFFYILTILLISNGHMLYRSIHADKIIFSLFWNKSINVFKLISIGIDLSHAIYQPFRYKSVSQIQFVIDQSIQIQSFLFIQLRNNTKQINMSIFYMLRFIIKNTFFFIQNAFFFFSQTNLLNQTCLHIDFIPVKQQQINYQGWIKMNTNQQFELKIGVYHHPSLKTNQLIQFLAIESNQFLTNELPQNLMIRQTFYSVFQAGKFPQQLTDFNEYVGLLIIYSSSSRQTFQYAKKCLPSTDQLTGQQFVIIIQMDNTEKKSNVIGNEGQELCKKLSLLFIRLTLKNPEDLVANLNRSMYLMIENYYYPNEEEKHKESNSLEVQVGPNQYFLQYSQSQQIIVADTQQKFKKNNTVNHPPINNANTNNHGTSNSHNNNTNNNIDSEQKSKMFSMIDRVSTSRKNRQNEMIAEQNAIDESIENVEKVLNNINRHIKQKLQSNWFTNLKNSLYKPIQKQSKNYNKIKLTQEFLDQVKTNNKAPRQIFKNKAKESIYRQNIFHSKYNSSLQQSLKKLDSSLMKMIITFDEIYDDKVAGSKMVEIQVFQSSTYEQLAANALKKLEIFPSDKNLKKMIGHIKQKIEVFIRQLSKGIRIIQRQRTFERSYLDVNKK